MDTISVLLSQQRCRCLTVSALLSHSCWLTIAGSLLLSRTVAVSLSHRRCLTITVVVRETPAVRETPSEPGDRGDGKDACARLSRRDEKEKGGSVCIHVRLSLLDAGEC